jgi:hypothetical protein
MGRFFPHAAKAGIAQKKQSKVVLAGSICSPHRTKPPARAKKARKANRFSKMWLNR